MPNNGKWIMVYIIIGIKVDGSKDGPYWSDDLNYAVKKIAPWLESRECNTYDIAGCLIPEDAYYRIIPPNPDIP